MPYRSKRGRRTTAVIIGLVALAIVGVIVIGRLMPHKKVDPIVYATNDSAFVDDELGVFQETAPEVATAAPPSASPKAVTTARPAVTTAATRQKAMADVPRYHAIALQRPRDALALNNYAWKLHLAGDYADAEKTLRDVIAIAPNRAIAYANLGETLWKQHRNAEAAAMYRRFLALNTMPRREEIAQHKVEQITGKPFTE